MAPQAAAAGLGPTGGVAVGVVAGVRGRAHVAAGVASAQQCLPGVPGLPVVVDDVDVTQETVVPVTVVVLGVAAGRRVPRA